MKTAVAGFLFLIFTAAPALAGEPGEKAAGEIVGITLLPAALVLLALPLAVVFRVSVGIPSRIAGTLEERPYRSLLLGAGNLLLLVLLSAASGSAPAIGLVAKVLWALFLVAALLGLTGVASRLAGRLGRGEGAGGYTLAWLLLAGLPLLPYLGLLALLWLLTGGVGATLLAVYGRGPSSST